MAAAQPPAGASPSLPSKVGAAAGSQPQPLRAPVLLAPAVVRCHPPLCHATAPAPSPRHPGHPGQPPHLMVTEMLRASRGALASPPLPIAPPQHLAPAGRAVGSLSGRAAGPRFMTTARFAHRSRPRHPLSLTAVVLHPPQGVIQKPPRHNGCYPGERDLCLAEGFFFFCMIIFLLLTVYPPSPGLIRMPASPLAESSLGRGRGGRR